MKIFGKQEKTPEPAPDLPATKLWRAVVGIQFQEQRWEPGEEVPLFVVESAPWLIEQGCVEVKQ